MLKKIIAGVSILLILIIAAVYILIPTDISINNNLTVTTTDAHVFQFLNHQKEWRKWWPGKTVSDYNYQYNNHLYTINQLNNDDVLITVANPELTIYTKFSFLSTDANKVKLNWNSVKTSSFNPINRFETFLQMNRMKKDMNAIMLQFKRFIEDDRNIYEMDVRISKVKNSTILATNLVTQQYPEMKKVYELIEKLRLEIRKQHALETGSPMLNVHQTDLKRYEIMVGIPVNQTINPPKNMLVNHMVLGGNMLETTVKGGVNITRNAFNQLEKYKKDHNLVSPAMPFESLITDRSKENDTAKWVTKIYYPIF
ncbi:MAG: AraC family transcriptional regulator [Sphingobacteriaceae bacterium]|nr:MAG: AraC family transcriptional regulator [Sphingobacteriaceae bacterium]